MWTIECADEAFRSISNCSDSFCPKGKDCLMGLIELNSCKFASCGEMNVLKVILIMLTETKASKKEIYNIIRLLNRKKEL